MYNDLMKPCALCKGFRQFLVQMVLDNPLAKEGGAGDLPRTTYCLYLNDSGQVQIFLYQMVPAIKIFHNITQSFEQIPRALRSLIYFDGCTLQVWDNGYELDFRPSPV